MSTDSKTPSKIVVNEVGGRPGQQQAPAVGAPGNSLARSINDRYLAEPSWAKAQINTLPTYRIGGKNYTTTNVAKLAAGRRSLDPRPVPSKIPTREEINLKYGGNQLKPVMTREQIARRKAVAAKNQAHLQEPLVQGEAFGERSQQQIQLQRKRLKSWGDEQP